MRYIDLNVLLQRRGRWGHRRELWKNRTLSEDFRNALFGKCWYTEASLTGADTDIDHFRPKANVKQYKGHNYNSPLKTIGYSWLKNEPSNYRCSCIYANRPRSGGGKWDYFPLAEDSPLGTQVNGCDAEKPLLLDPCCQEDVNLIMYHPGGKVGCISADEAKQLRVKVSEDLYNWKNADISKERSSVWYDVERIIERYKAGRTLEEDCIEDLRKAISRKATYSACAISCVQSLAPDSIKEKLDLTL